MHLLCLLSSANFRAVLPFLVTAWMLACALRHDRPSVRLPYHMPPDTAPASNTITHACEGPHL